MFAGRLLRRMDLSPTSKLYVGSIVLALAISPGMVAVAQLLGVALDPGIPPALGAVAAATFAARLRQESHN